MQSFIIEGVENKYYFYGVLTKIKIKHINIVQETVYTLNKENNENTVMLQNCRRK
jgi:hypothetical protein